MVSNGEEDIAPMYVDFGASYVKWGIGAYDETPESIPNIVGRPIFPATLCGASFKEIYIGDEAIKKRGILDFKCPLKNGTITNWEDAESIIEETFY